jgi:phosphoglycerate dehydrogenase-like enzyme
VRAAASLEDLFRENDIVVELAPLIPATVNCVTERHLRLIRPGGVFVNLGRGGVVEPEGLLRVAREGKILFGLDVFVEEPLPAESPLRGLRNVCLTPHLAGPTTDRRRDATIFALRNLSAYLAGEPLEAHITPAVYDAST